MRRALELVPFLLVVGCANGAESPDGGTPADGPAEGGGIRDGARDAARDGSGCGALGEPCCPTPLPRCEPALACSTSGTCTCPSGTRPCGSVCIPTANCCSDADCPAADQCHNAGLCNPGTGACSSPLKPNDTPCNDGNACTRSDTCQNGVCSGANPVVCTASDACHQPGTCNPATGACSNPARPNGSPCDDGNACTRSDTCQNGACAGANPVVCSASDACHDPGSCNPATGACSNPPKPNGTACDDGNACTVNDTCQNGACTAGGPRCPGALCVGGNCCGALGQACCPSGPACAAGSCLGARCVDYAGGFQREDPGTVCGGACRVSNPFTGACSCPPNFATSCYRVIDDCAGGGTQNGSVVCVCGASGPFPGGSFGGVFQNDDPVGCSAGCRGPNPYTGGCSCPAGTSPVGLRTIVDTPVCGGALLGSLIVACVGSGPRTTFGGVWQVDDGCPGGCRAGNPLTGGCACPSGFGAQAFRLEVDTSCGFFGSQVMACVGPP